jgi:hypothetical protein
VLVREQQPHLLGGVPVQLEPALHGLGGVALAGHRLDVQLLPGQRVLPVVPIRAGRVVRVPVDRDLHQVPGDRLVARVVERSFDPAPVGAFGVFELGDLAFDDQAGARRHPLRRHRGVAMRGRSAAGVPQFVVLLESGPDRAARREHRFRTPREVLGGLVPSSLDMADVRRIEAHPRGQLLFGHPPLDPPLGKGRDELVGSPLDGRGGHHGCPLRDGKLSVAVARCPQEASSALPTDTLTKPATPPLSVSSVSLGVFARSAPVGGRLSHRSGRVVRLGLARYGESPERR